MHNRYLRNISFALVASVLSKVIGGFSSFFIAKTLQPANFGIWLTMMLFVSYSSLLTLGTLETLLKQVPFFKGKGDLKAIKDLECVVFTEIVMAGLFILIFGFMMQMFVTQLRTNSIVTPARIMAVAASLSFPSAFYYYRFIAHQNFKIMGLIETMRALLYILLVVGLSYTWGLTGAAVGFCLSEIIICLSSGILSRQYHGPVKLSFNIPAIMKSIAIGFPITIFVWLSMLQGSVDRLISISLLGEVPTGYYGIGISIVSVLFLIPNSISKVLYPRISEKLGETEREEDLFRLVVIPTRALCLIMAGVIGIVVILMPYLYQIIPKYIPGLAAGQILLVLSVFRLSTATGVNFLIATNRQNQLLLLVLASLCIGIIAAYGAVWLGWGIEGLAASTCFSGVFLSISVWRLVFSGIGFVFTKQLDEIMKLHVPFLLLILILGLGVRVVPKLFLQKTMLAMAYGLSYAIIYVCILFVIPFTRQWSAEILILLRRAIAPKGIY